ncbi:uncharacterized protein LOC141673883 [Apium graveolens]|uniref:uncharacterized protein LOC141673883 n=1 Tax=Apium graveolens TaxID=4045 RepID=UPI003D7A0EEC
MRQDCEEYSRRCKPCQFYSCMNHRPFVTFNPLSTPCPFYMWGIDLVGPLPKSSKQCQYIIVAVDYFIKWVEAKPLARIREIDAFIRENWKNVLVELEIQHIKSSVAYPHANGQVEITNNAVLQGLKKRLIDANRNWVGELPNVLWRRTSPKASTGQTPFRMAYGTGGSPTNGDRN